MAKRTKYPIHPDFKRGENLNHPLNRAMIPVMQGIMCLLYKQEKSTAELTVERKTIPVEGGSIRALWYCPKNVNGTLRPVWWFITAALCCPLRPITTALRQSTPFPYHWRTATPHIRGLSHTQMSLVSTLQELP